MNATDEQVEAAVSVLFTTSDETPEAQAMCKAAITETIESALNVALGGE